MKNTVIFIRQESDALDFLDLCRLALTSAQVIKLRAANLTATDQLNVIYAGRMDRESTLHSNAVRYATNSKCLPNAAVALGNDGSFKSLETFAVAFHDLYPDTHGITDIEVRKITPDLLRLDRTDDFIHDVCLLPL